MFEIAQRLRAVGILSCGLAVAVALAVALAVAMSATALAQTPPDRSAHALAQKFATGGAPPETVKKDQPEAKKPPAKDLKPADRTRRDAEIRALQRKRDAEGAAALGAARQRSLDEAEMLSQARAEQTLLELRDRDAELQRTEDARLAAEEAAAMAAERQADADAAERLQRETEARRLVQEQIAEADRRGAEAKAKAEEEQRRAAAEHLETERKARLEAERRAAETDRLQAEKREAERLARLEAERRAADGLARQDAELREAKSREMARLALEAAREEENRRLLEKLDNARAARSSESPARPYDSASRLAGPPSGDAPEDFIARPESAPARNQAFPTLSNRVTVLLLMEPGTRGIRQFEKTADPILCVMDGCYISNGPATPAAFLPGRKAFGFGNTIGQRAGACRKSLSCAFRDVDLAGSSGFLQPVDMRWLRHDRREGRRVSVDTGCRAEPGRLECSRAVTSENYRMWIVPEEAADVAGAKGLEAALAGDLETRRNAELKRPYDPAGPR